MVDLGLSQEGHIPTYFEKILGLTFDWAERVTHQHILKRFYGWPWTEPRGSHTNIYLKRFYGWLWTEPRGSDTNIFWKDFRVDLGLNRESHTPTYFEKILGWTLDWAERVTHQHNFEKIWVISEPQMNTKMNFGWCMLWRECMTAWMYAMLSFLLFSG